MAAALETIAEVYARHPHGGSEDAHSRHQPNANPSHYLFHNRSFFRRAWDKVESIFIQNKDASLPSYHQHHFDNTDDDEIEAPLPPTPTSPSQEFQPQYQHHRMTVYGANAHKRRLSQHSEDLITAPTGRSSDEWPIRLTYEDWQRDHGEDVEQAKIKDMIAGWAMGEVGPWFD